MLTTASILSTHSSTTWALCTYRTAKCKSKTQCRMGDALLLYSSLSASSVKREISNRLYSQLGLSRSDAYSAKLEVWLLADDLNAMMMMRCVAGDSPSICFMYITEIFLRWRMMGCKSLAVRVKRWVVSEEQQQHIDQEEIKCNENDKYI